MVDQTSVVRGAFETVCDERRKGGGGVNDWVVAKQSFLIC